MRHGVEELHAFQQGESRLVLARRRAEGSVVFMADGCAEDFRETIRSGEVICIVRSCPAPRLQETADDGRRRADVVLTFENGRRIAFEVQSRR